MTDPLIEEARRWVAQGRASGSPSAYVTCRTEEVFALIERLADRLDEPNELVR